MHQLAASIGLARTWRDVDGAEQVVADTMLAAIAEALGYPCGSAAQIAESLAVAAAEQAAPPKLIVTEVGQPTPLPNLLPRAELAGEDGAVTALELAGWQLPPIAKPGYYTLRLGAHELTLAVAPARSPNRALLGDGKLWGPAIQIPALRGAASSAFGGFGELADAVRLFATRGADALAINPVHALFPGDGQDFSPYSPSSRRFMNAALGDPALLGLPPLPPHPGGPLIDWESALPQRLVDLRHAFARLGARRQAAIARDCAARGEELHRQAIFDALDCHFRPQGKRGWREWPQLFHDPAGKAVQQFAVEQADEVAFHAFCQWLAAESMAAVQQQAKDAGMRLGLIADLAVGVHTGGSDSWMLGDGMLQGLTIGAPPDPLGPHGQNWALTSFSPRGLAASGYAPWIATLRAALTRAGGLRIDHAFGLARLWVVPAGQPSRDGAYLTYPFRDLLRLAALEAHRAGAILIAEDLGTMPWGFGEAIRQQDLLGMRVLWFERAADEGFIGAQDYPAMSVAMTGTHDTATVAGWWRGTDLGWAEKLGRLPEETTRAKAEAKREWDRGLLWSTIGDGTPHPAASEPEKVVAAALRHIGQAGSQLAIAPLEDLLALEEQPNLPGTITEHPNWRRRLAAPLDALLAEPDTAARIAALDETRKAGD